MRVVMMHERAHIGGSEHDADAISITAIDGAYMACRGLAMEAVFHGNVDKIMIERLATTWATAMRFIMAYPQFSEHEQLKQLYRENRTWLRNVIESVMAGSEAWAFWKVMRRCLDWCCMFHLPHDTHCAYGAPRVGELYFTVAGDTLARRMCVPLMAYTEAPCILTNERVINGLTPGSSPKICNGKVTATVAPLQKYTEYIKGDIPPFILDLPPFEEQESLDLDDILVPSSSSEEDVDDDDDEEFVSLDVLLGIGRDENRETGNRNRESVGEENSDNAYIAEDQGGHGEEDNNIDADVGEEDNNIDADVGEEDNNIDADVGEEDRMDDGDQGVTGNVYLLDSDSFDEQPSGSNVAQEHEHDGANDEVLYTRASARRAELITRTQAALAAARAVLYSNESDDEFSDRDDEPAYRRRVDRSTTTSLGSRRRRSPVNHEQVPVQRRRTVDDQVVPTARLRGHQTPRHNTNRPSGVQIPNRIRRQ
ncbi:LORF3 [anatid alphaherpesvirus 1]|uniref:LORF-3 n=1 Tax=anatid alphaherpesvirus 1 TaxID=104388 RepID=B5AN06_9ALPH|nr:LORF-3 [Anatid alphaherpesvirus 1]AFC61884.1 LORF3 [Anatid alphaherpesvirus 1]